MDPARKGSASDKGWSGKAVRWIDGLQSTFGCGWWGSVLIVFGLDTLLLRKGVGRPGIDIRFNVHEELQTCIILGNDQKQLLAFLAQQEDFLLQGKDIKNVWCCINEVAVGTGKKLEWTIRHIMAGRGFNFLGQPICGEGCKGNHQKGKAKDRA